MSSEGLRCPQRDFDENPDAGRHEGELLWRRGSGKWSNKKGGKAKGRGSGKSADLEPNFKGKCDDCGVHGHKAISCQPVRQTCGSRDMTCVGERKTHRVTRLRARVARKDSAKR